MSSLSLSFDSRNPINDNKRIPWHNECDINHMEVVQYNRSRGELIKVRIQLHVY